MKTMALVLLGITLFAGAVAPANAAAQTQPSVIVAIDAAIASLRQQPNQFSLVVQATGLSVTSSGPGTGMKIEVTGGGAGSQTTGLNVTTSSAQVNIAQNTADQGLKQEAEKAILLLSEIKTLLLARKVDKPSVMPRLTEFGKTYVAPALKSVIEALVKKALRL